MTRVLTLVSLTLALAALALASPTSADTTKEFLASCKVNPKSCSDYVLTVKVLAIMDKTKRDLTCLPKGYKTAEVVKTILDWLSDRSELADESAGAAIEKAFIANYPNTQACRDTYIATDPFPATTEDFLAYCADEPKDREDTCYSEIIRVGLRMRLDNPDAVCAVKADAANKQAFRDEHLARDAAIRKWLSEHKETWPQPRAAGIAAAYGALFSPPCS